MRLSFNQPAFIPWGGFFARLIRSDKMVLLDDTVLAQGFTYVNRNRLKGPAGDIWITVPLRRKGRGPQKIKDLEIHEPARWAHKFLPTLRHYYGTSVHFATVFPAAERAVSAAGGDFLALARGLLAVLVEGLEIKRDVVLQSGIGVRGKGTALLVATAKELGAREVVLPCGAEKAVDATFFARENIKVLFLRYLPVPHPQFWGDFRANLSALDLLLCLGPAGRGVIEKGIRVID